MCCQRADNVPKEILEIGGTKKKITFRIPYTFPPAFCCSGGYTSYLHGHALINTAHTLFENEDWFII